MAWELGGGLGHVTALRPVAEELRNYGHQVLLAARNVCAAEKVFRGTGVRFVQAPFKQGPAAKPIAPQRSFAHLLHHAGFEFTHELAALTSAWSALFDIVDPDVTLFDHSPTALLASRGRRMKRVLLGTGFYAPPVGELLPDMRPWLPDETETLRQDESRTLAVVNGVLERSGQPPLEQLSDIYGQVDLNLLMTYRELDHFGPRECATYWGTFTACPSVKPVWPSNRGKRIFAYLKRTKGVRETIRALGQCGHPTLVFAPWLTDDTDSSMCYSNVRFSSEPFDMFALARGCDVAVLNGTHGATAEFLLAGKPILQLPIYLEQRLVARCTEQIGAGLSANRTNFGDIRQKLNAVIDGSEFRKNAESFASKYAGRNRREALMALTASIDALAM